MVFTPSTYALVGILILAKKRFFVKTGKLKLRLNLPKNCQLTQKRVYGAIKLANLMTEKLAQELNYIKDLTKDDRLKNSRKLKFDKVRHHKWGPERSVRVFSRRLGLR